MAYLATIHDLPEDILLKVMDASHVHRFPHCRLYNSSTPDSPVTLAQVCRRWRQSALALPSLWSCIHVTPELSSGCDDMVDAYLSRSGYLPLTIVFICHTTAFKEHPGWDVGWEEFESTIWPRFKRSWDHLVLQQSRWKHCAIYSLYAEASVYLIQSLDRAIFPQLEHFGVTSYSEVDEDTTDCTLKFFAPALTHFRTDIVPTLHSSSEFFQNLTELKLSKVTIEAGLLARILASVSSTLTVLVLAEVLVVRPHTITLTPMTIRRLRYIALCMVHGVDPAGSPVVQISITSFVPLLCQGSPELRTFHLSCDGEFLMNLCNSSTKSTFKQVERLEYATTHRERSAWVLLTRFTSLRELYLLQPIDISFVLDQITRESYSMASWRHLHTLAIQGEAKGSTLLKLLQARARIGCPIRKLVLGQETLSRLTPSVRDSIQGFGVEVMPYPGQPVPPDSSGLTILAWDTDRDRPAFVPWNNTYLWDFEDQFKNNIG
ncbi:hypothetical protein PHLGIDRAFT_417507 [Phlebiopsis gigantea 11061_1 CR5-6]|uniref:Uncharacterized protein n=1 Tax=Phlebiopsis gigantea (strain 11061_1 CR5-6) TaxID=745531 RepID=A0A0C3SFC6_PHLG1|nr:hypothetical protein PHLGIDRAFT_417507 [Phlebiopsis gigantea 11061_1 CR5-6]